ncbi:MAG: type II toxin-antitoxin system HicB family antitoxin [Thermomicrobia bacterium]|nr:type II toxin-antitoxin system HicB family antitoxin [Thermomicrobia bacterium]
MFSKYVETAMRHADYSIMEDGTHFFGEVPQLDGVWANAPTLKACRDELKDVIEGWLMLGIAMHHEIPPIDGIAIIVGVAA